jgi:phenylalanyl-tRNA synthetase beta chain
MKISYNWLKAFVDFSFTPEELSEILTNTGLEVEGIEKIEAVKGGLVGVIVGEVMSCTKHPDADKLNVTEVFTGSETLQIVCGAPNVAQGQKVLVATVGCTLYPTPEEPFTIKKAKIRGVESNGMICAEDELGIGKDHNGIMVLPTETQPGTLASSYFNFSDDYIFEIGLTPNRADAMGHIGVARDIAAYQSFHFKKKSSVKNPIADKINFPPNNDELKISILDDNCLRYIGVKISGITVSPSPEWLQQRLRSIGVAPINNIVDVTNYVMRELGTPLHAFDAEKLGNKIVVRSANQNETLMTLDKIQRTFKGGELVICDENSPVCIAGVLGGFDSGVSQNTKDIFLESAVFDMTSVRKTARLHGINSDASFRFERGVDKTLTELAIRRACQMIVELSGGTITTSLVDQSNVQYHQNKISFSPEEINSILGTSISDADLEGILLSLDFEITKENNLWTALVPYYRIDVERTCDLAEEVLRIYGFNNVMIPERMTMSVQTQIGIDTHEVKSTIAEFLVANGFVEAMNNSLTKSNYYKEISFLRQQSSDAVRLLNPLSQDLEFLRTSLIPGLLENITYNQNRQSVDLRFFEFGKSYINNENGYQEKNWLTLVVTGRKNEENWVNSPESTDFYFTKGIAEKLLIRLGLSSKLEYQYNESPLLSELVIGSIHKKELLSIGKLNQEVQRFFDIKKPVFIIEINWEVLTEILETVKIQFKELPKTFVVRRDFSLLLDRSVGFTEIEKTARQIDKKLLKNINLFDVYEGDKLEKDKKSYAVSFHFQDDERTLVDKEIDGIMDKIRKALEEKFAAQLR